MVKIFLKMPTAHEPFDAAAALEGQDYSLKFIYSEKATKFSEISALLLTDTTQDKSNVEISQNFVAFSEYMNFNEYYRIQM